jgi:hypothetical protein
VSDGILSVPQPEEVLKSIHRLRTWAAQYAANSAGLEAQKAALMQHSASMEMALLEAREELEKLNEIGVSDEVIEMVGDPTFIAKCGSFRPQAALLKRFGVRSTDGNG